MRRRSHHPPRQTALWSATARQCRPTMALGLLRGRVVARRRRSRCAGGRAARRRCDAGGRTSDVCARQSRRGRGTRLACCAACSCACSPADRDSAQRSRRSSPAPAGACLQHQIRAHGRARARTDLSASPMIRLFPQLCAPATFVAGSSTERRGRLSRALVYEALSKEVIARPYAHEHRGRSSTSSRRTSFAVLVQQRMAACFDVPFRHFAPIAVLAASRAWPPCARRRCRRRANPRRTIRRAAL